MRQIDQSHIRYRKRAVQRAQFLLLSDRSSQGSVTALLRRYAEEIKTPDQLFAPDDGPVAKHLHLYPAAVFGAKPLYPPAAPRSETPLAPVRQAGLDAEQLRKEQQLLLDYARMAVTEENVGLLAKQALAARSAVAASTLAEEYPAILPASSACTPTRSRRAGLTISPLPETGSNGAASGLKSLF